MKYFKILSFLFVLSSLTACATTIPESTATMIPSSTLAFTATGSFTPTPTPTFTTTSTSVSTRTLTFTTTTPSSTPSLVSFPTFDHWSSIDKYYSDEELIRKYEENSEFGEINYSSREEPYGLIVGWTGIINGVGNVRFTIGDSDWNSIILIVAFFNYDKDGYLYVVNLPITVCVSNSSNSSCFYNYISVNPTENKPGTDINTNELDVITSIFLNLIGEKIRNYIILPGKISDSSSIINGIQTEIWDATVNEFIQDACSGSCYLLDYSSHIDHHFGPDEIPDLLEKYNNPWGLFVQGTQFYSENER